MEAKIAELCEIEVELYLDYYNDEKQKYEEFNKKLDENQDKIINLVYDLLEDGFDEKKILSAIKSQGEYYKQSPEWFGEDDDSSNYPSGYYESNKNKKYPFNETCGRTLSLAKKLFKKRKSVKAELSLRDKLSEEGIRELIMSHLMAMTKKKNKSRRKKNKKSKRKRSKKSKRRISKKR